MPLPYPKPTNHPDAFQASNITFNPQSLYFQVTVEHLKTETVMVDVVLPQEEGETEPKTEEQPQSVTKVVGHQQISLTPEQVTDLMQSKPVGDTVYQVVKNAINAWLGENYQP